MLKRTLDKRLVLAVGLVMLLLLVGAGSALASDIRNGDSVIIGANEVIDDDLLIFANTIVVNGTINGDLIAFGNLITLNGTVNGSAVLAGQTVKVSGEVTGTVYSGGSAFTLAPAAVIGRNILFGGYSLETQAGSTVGRDLIAGGSQATIAGKVARDVLFAGQALAIDGGIGRNVRAAVAEPSLMPMGAFYGPNVPPAIPAGLAIANDANIGGQLIYSSPVDQSSGIQTVPAGGVVYQATPEPVQPEAVPAAYEWIFLRLRDFFTVLIIGLAAILLIPRVVNAAVLNAQTKPLAATGWGLVVLIAGYVLAALVFAAVLMLGILVGITTLGGLAAAVFSMGLSGLVLGLTAFTAVVLWGAKVIVACLVGKLLLQQFVKSYADRAIVAFLLGLVLFEIVATIPVLGFFVTVVTVLLGLGAIWYVWYDRRKTVQFSTPKPAPLPA
jgi:hypothetical protein